MQNEQLNKRENDRKANELRQVKITKDVNKWAEGSVIIEFGNTKVLCTATVESKVPDFLKVRNSNGQMQIQSGWVTAEYSMLPRSTHQRVNRERGKPNARSLEIQRLIGRALRASVDLVALGERSITIDCDVLQADGGTRTASITGGFVALALAIKKLQASGNLSKNPIKQKVCAVSVGLNKGEALLDLDYVEDSSGDVDLNCIMTEDGKLVEVQGTGEHSTFSFDELGSMVKLAQLGGTELFKLQAEALQS